MGVGFGATPVVNASNEVVSGTTDSDLRKIWGALYQPGLVTGGEVAPSPTGQSYTVTAGVAVIKMATGEHVLAPIPAKTVDVVPTGSARTDIIYARQNVPNVEGNSDVEIVVGQALPAARVVELGRFTQSATATSTMGGVRSGEVNYAIPYGSNLGTIWRMQDTMHGQFVNRTTIGQGTFYLPTDRQLRASMTTVIVADGASGFDNSRYCEASYNLYIDGRAVAVWRSPGLHQAWQWVQFETVFNCAAGTHTISVDRGREIGPGTPFQTYGHSSTPGCLVELKDDGVSI